jgi:hypothetical protein
VSDPRRLDQGPSRRFAGLGSLTLFVVLYCQLRGTARLVTQLGGDLSPGPANGAQLKTRARLGRGFRAAT